MEGASAENTDETCSDAPIEIYPDDDEPAAATGGEASDDGTEARLVLAERVTAEQASALAETLRQCNGRDLVIDASQVVQVTTPCLQVLAAAAASWRTRGASLCLLEPSEDFLMVLSQLGLAPEILQSVGSAEWQ